jgi:hypothetical protein
MVVNFASPALMVTLPPTPLAEEPTIIEMAPEGLPAPSALPVPTTTAPEVPDCAEPELTIKEPLAPEAALLASALLMVTLPEEVLVAPPKPETIEMEPPLLVPAPAVIVTAPPVEAEPTAAPALRTTRSRRTQRQLSPSAGKRPRKRTSIHVRDFNGAANSSGRS